MFESFFFSLGVVAGALAWMPYFFESRARLRAELELQDAKARWKESEALKSLQFILVNAAKGKRVLSYRADNGDLMSTVLEEPRGPTQ